MCVNVETNDCLHDDTLGIMGVMSDDSHLIGNLLFILFLFLLDFFREPLFHEPTLSVSMRN